MRTVQSVRMLQATAVVASLAILLWSIGVPSIGLAQAASLTSVSDTIGDSAPNATTDHTIAYTIPAASGGVESGETITVTFPADFTGTSSVSVADVDLEVNSADQTLTAGAPGAAEWQFSWSGQTLTLTSGGAGAVANATDPIVIQIGSSADSGTDRLINPGTEGSYEISIVSGTGGNNDNGFTRVAIIDAVTVTAAVDTIFTFAVSGTAAGTSVNGDTTTGNTTTTTIPFGTLSPGSATTSAQALTVNTNAANGYVVTVQLDGYLESSTGATIDNFQDGSDTNTPGTWASPAGTLGSANTYGHWGITSDDSATTRVTEFGASEYVAATTSPRVVMSHTGPANGTGVGVGTTTVGYKIEITALQEAGDDYEATLTYIATPTF